MLYFTESRTETTYNVYERMARAARPSAFTLKDPRVGIAPAPGGGAVSFGFSF